MSDIEGASEVTEDPKVVSIDSRVVNEGVAGRVPVRISYGIIERFSEGLYSSPNKTFEELITNSYDAGATQVWVYTSADLSTPEATLVVVDDGESMDLAGLTGLWKIGESSKRTDSPPPGRRKPVGKFGIGKLATYVLARKLTYIVHRDGNFLAVTMDYGRVSGSTELLDGVDLTLEVVTLTQPQARQALESALSNSSAGASAKALSVLASGPHWTAAILSELKPAGREIKQGRLKWVLRSALPLNPDFRLFFNDEEVQSSKADGQELWSFRVGENEDTLVSSTDTPWGPAATVEVEAEVDGVPTKVPAVRLPHAGIVWGVATLYKDPLERGRSEDLGRSHGFFVRVRGRLVNLYDEDFSVGPELRHGTLTRFRMEVNADDLDDQVASARESLKESPALQELKNYLLAVFNKARGISAEHDDDDVISNIAKDGRLAKPSAALSQSPLRRMLQRAVDGDAAVAQSLGLTDDSLAETGGVLAEGGDVVQKLLLEPSGVESPMVSYDPARRAVVLNQAHPFVNNYIGGKAASEPLRLLGLSELLTQAYLLDERVDAAVVMRVMNRRDSFLRELAYRFPRSAPVIAQRLRAATNDQDALEDAVGDALEILGYSMKRLGGAQHGPDGIATARLGKRDGESASYAFTYDAKSTKDLVRAALAEETSQPGKIRADTARTSVLKVHRDRAAAAHELEVAPTFTLLVAPDFQGALDEEGLINAVCVNDGITAMRVDDLARLVELFALQGLNPADLRPLMDLRTPEETREWVDTRSTSARVPRPPVAVIVETLVANSERKNPMSYDSVAAYLVPQGYDLDSAEIQSLVRGLAAIAPKSVYFDGSYVALNATPAALYAEIRDSLDEFDTELVSAYLATVPEAEPPK